LVDDLLKRARQLHREAGDLMRLLKVKDVLQPFGEVVPTGSYYLDLMVYPDLDLYVPKTAIPDIFAASGKMANTDMVIRVSFENELHPGLEGGLFINFRVNIGGWGRPWKVDIWWLEPVMITKKMEIMVHFRKILTPELRLSILKYKNSIMTKDRRTPMYSGYYIYKAFLDEGLSDPEHVTQYLLSKGIIFA
jgi:hypothetical protein